MNAPGRFNALTDVAGIQVGSFTDTATVSGVTVVLCTEGAVGAVDVRGAAPGTRETDLLAPENLVEKVQGIVLSGGSVYGLGAADGVVRWLSERGCGFPLGDGQVAPIVPAAVLFDLGRGSQFVPPVNAEWGRLACEAAAGERPLDMGCVGAGTGAMAGGIKGGLGSASLVLDSGLTVAALMAVNPNGSVINPATGAIVTFASLAALRPAARLASYTAAKAGVIGLTRALARELRDDRIRVNAIAPGMVRTAHNEAQVGPDAKVRWVELDQITAAVRYLVSDDATAVTGQVLAVTAGDV